MASVLVSFLVDSRILSVPSNSIKWNRQLIEISNRGSKHSPSELSFLSCPILMVTYLVCLSGLGMILFLSDLAEPLTDLLSNDALLIAAGAPPAAAVLSAILFWR